METNNSPPRLTELWAYACSPYRYFWRHVARTAPLQTARGLVEATTRARVLEPFVSGRVTKRDGPRYKVPEMSKKYERRARDAGLPQLAARLDERLASAPVLSEEDCGLDRAFSDSVEIASRNTWPALNAVVGADLRYEVELTDGHRLEGRGELVTRAGEREVNVEVHDYDRPVCLPVALLRRDLRVVAGLQAQSREWAVDHAGGNRGGDPAPCICPRAGRAVAGMPELPHPLCTDGQDVLDTLDPTLLAQIGILVVTQEDEEGGVPQAQSRKGPRCRGMARAIARTPLRGGLTPQGKDKVVGNEHANRPQILAARGAADYLRITPDTLYKLINEGRIPAARVGRQYRIHRAHLEQWLESQS